MNDIIILSLLLEGPKHGYRLKQEAALFTSEQQLHNNTVYPLLNQFLKRGWITRREAEGERGQTRLLYELSEAGRRVLIEKLNEFSETDAASANAFHLRVGLFWLLDPSSRRRVLELRDAHLQARQARMERIGAMRSLEGWPAKTLDYIVGEIAHERRWIAELAKAVEED